MRVSGRSDFADEYERLPTGVTGAVPLCNSGGSVERTSSASFSLIGLSSFFSSPKICSTFSLTSGAFSVLSLNSIAVLLPDLSSSRLWTFFFDFAEPAAMTIRKITATPIKISARILPTLSSRASSFSSSGGGNSSSSLSISSFRFTGEASSSSFSSSSILFSTLRFLLFCGDFFRNFLACLFLLYHDFLLSKTESYLVHKSRNDKHILLY